MTRAGNRIAGPRPSAVLHGQRPAVPETSVAVATGPALTLLPPGRPGCHRAGNHLSILSRQPGELWPCIPPRRRGLLGTRRLPLPGDRRPPFLACPPPHFPFSRGNDILQLEVNTPHMRKVATEPRFLMAFPHASEPGARQGTSREPPRRLEGPNWGRPHPDASLDGAGSFKRSRGGGGVRLKGARSGVPVLVCRAVSLAPSHSVSPLPSFPLFFFSFDTKVGL